MEIIYFLLGILFFYFGKFELLLGLLFFPRFKIILALFLGGLLAFGHDVWVKPYGLPDRAMLSKVQISGRVVTRPQAKPGRLQFTLAIDSLDGHRVGGLVQLSWYNHPPVLSLGETWDLQVNLRKPRNYKNPGSADYQSQLAARHVFWMGYVNSGQRKEKPLTGSLDRFRERLGQQVEAVMPDVRSAAVVNALALGLTHGMTQEDWTLFRETGVTHLLIISGSHIALVSSLIFYGIAKIWACWPWACLRLPAPYLGSVAALISALIYTVLAGFNVPAQRALISLLIVTFSLLVARCLTVWQIWRYALAGVLLLEPHAVLMPGFYLSFIAVAILFLSHQRWRLRGIKAYFFVQWGCLLGLLPLTLYWFAYGSMNGFLANMWAIPLVGFLVVPLSLLVVIFSSSPWIAILVQPLQGLIAVLFKGLMWMQQLAFMNLNLGIYSWISVVLLMGALLFWTIFPVFWPRVLALLWVGLAFFPPREFIAVKEARLHVLDVGQGLAVVIQTAHHTLLYDTGDKFYQGNDLGNLVILPFLNSNGIKKLDKVVISHPDKDHQGGLKSVLEHLPPFELIVDEPRYYSYPSRSCHGYSEWIWDGVVFRFFAIQASFKEKNNRSCVLQVETASRRFLLTGDIESRAESYLLETYGRALASEILVVPHHGSRTSSSLAFLKTVNPRLAIASLGYLNRFHFPHPEVLKRYHSLGIPFRGTNTSGRIMLYSGGLEEGFSNFVE